MLNHMKKNALDNKQSGARSVVEQSANLGGQHLTTKIIEKKITLINELANINKNKFTSTMKKT